LQTSKTDNKALNIDAIYNRIFFKRILKLKKGNS
jgi:hypothetical protein